jgi:tight adherence protein C
VTIVFYVALCLTSFCILALLLAPLILKPSRAARRVFEMVQSGRVDHRTIGTKERVQDAILALAKRLRSWLGLGEDKKLTESLLRAGIRSGQSGNTYNICRLAAPLVGIALGSLITQNTLFCSLAFGATFYLLPNLWLRIKIKKRRDRIRRSLPDALDLIVICVEAGLGLDQALLRIGQELAISHMDISQELMQINFEQLAGKPRVEAWKSAVERTEVEEFSLLVTMLTQADRFGTPIVRALSRFADEIRQKRRQRVEEKAAQTKIKILFPLVLFIFPCIFIVLLAPAILNIAKSMHVFK